MAVRAKSADLCIGRASLTFALFQLACSSPSAPVSGSPASSASPTPSVLSSARVGSGTGAPGGTSVPAAAASATSSTAPLDIERAVEALRDPDPRVRVDAAERLVDHVKQRPADGRVRPAVIAWARQEGRTTGKRGSGCNFAPGRAWQALIQLGELRPGMTTAELEAVMRSAAAPHAGSGLLVADSPCHVNPSLTVTVAGGRVVSFQQDVA